LNKNKVFKLSEIRAKRVYCTIFRTRG